MVRREDGELDGAFPAFQQGDDASDCETAAPAGTSPYGDDGE